MEQIQHEFPEDPDVDDEGGDASLLAHRGERLRDDVVQVQRALHEVVLACRTTWRKNAIQLSWCQRTLESPGVRVHGRDQDPGADVDARERRRRYFFVGRAAVGVAMRSPYFLVRLG